MSTMFGTMFFTSINANSCQVTWCNSVIACESQNCSLDINGNLADFTCNGIIYHLECIAEN